MKIHERILKQFKKTVWQYYTKNKRDLPWRNTLDPYRIVVSEMMLQQTQVSRVLLKYPTFIKQFPDFFSLAKAPVKVILMVWQGMGYNRRALYLQRIAQIIISKHHGIVPSDPVILDSFPGIGHATAGSIAAFVYNRPVVFLETNIRRAFIHHFFKDVKAVDDTQIYPLINVTLDRKNPREWYYALMDYGSNLVKIMENPNRKSKHYTVQSRFEGSGRQMRGQIIRLLIRQPLSEGMLIKTLKRNPDKINTILGDLAREGFIKKTRGICHIIKQ